MPNDQNDQRLDTQQSAAQRRANVPADKQTSRVNPAEAARRDSARTSPAANPGVLKAGQLKDDPLFLRDPQAAREAARSHTANEDADEQDVVHEQVGISSSELNSGAPHLKKRATKEARDKPTTNTTGEQDAGKQEA
jgi:hypothetical protein